MAHQEKEVFQSKAGIDYVQPKKLSSKVRVYTQAFLEKIPHSTEGKIDVCLKIGRYKLNGAVETKEPKSELTLENDELNNLIKYLEENYRPIKLGKGKYIAIDDSEASQLLYRFKSVVSSDENTARQLLESGVLTDNVYFTVAAFNPRLVNKVLSLGRTKGLGFDIQSVIAEAGDMAEFVKYIEVKSTKRVTAPDINDEEWIDTVNITRNEYFDVVYRTLLALRAIVVARLMVGTTMRLFFPQ